jgi:hypothetical protein
VIVHWRPTRNTYDRYGLCKPAVCTEVFDAVADIINMIVLGTSGSPVLLYDQVIHGIDDGEWHFISDCPYSQSARSQFYVQQGVLA